MGMNTFRVVFQDLSSPGQVQFLVSEDDSAYRLRSVRPATEEEKRLWRAYVDAVQRARDAEIVAGRLRQAIRDLEDARAEEVAEAKRGALSQKISECLENGTIESGTVVDRLRQITDLVFGIHTRDGRIQAVRQTLMSMGFYPKNGKKAQ